MPVADLKKSSRSPLFGSTLPHLAATSRCESAVDEGSLFPRRLALLLPAFREAATFR